MSLLMFPGVTADWPMGAVMTSVSQICFHKGEETFITPCYTRKSEMRPHLRISGTYD